MDWACVQATQSSKDEENKQDGQQTQHSCVSCVSCVSCSAWRMESTSCPWKRSSAISLALSKPKQCHTDNNPKDAPCHVTANFCASCTKMRLCVCATRAWQHDPNCKPTKQQQRSRHCLLCFGHRQNAAPILIRFFSAHITREDSSILDIGHVPTWPGLGRLVCLGGQTSTLEDIRQGQGQAPGLPPGHVETLELPEARR